MWTLVLLALIIFAFVYKKLEHHGFPPGPTGLPIVGVAPFLGKRPEVTLKKWSEKYGDIIGLRSGSEKIIVLNSHEAITEAFVSNGNITSDRPHNFMIETVGQNSGLSMRSRDGIWKEQKRFTLCTLKNLGFGKRSLEPLLNEEVRYLTESIRKKNGVYNNCKEDIVNAVSNVICQFTIGRRYHYEDDDSFARIVNHLTKIIKSEAFCVQLLLLMPMLRYLPYFSKSLKKTDEAYEKLYSFINICMKQHKETIDLQHTRDFIDEYLLEMKRKDKRKVEIEGGFNDVMLRGIVRDIFVAGSETTSSTILWTFLILSNRPEIQRKMQTEIDDVIGPEGTPTLKDSEKMDFTQAVMAEVFRYRPLVPLALPHTRTTLIPNIYSVHYDQEIWDKPKIFNPYRHFNNEGKFVQSKYIIPFGLGPRACPGKHMGKLQYFIFLVGILQKFNIKRIKSKATQEEISKSEEVADSGLVLAPPVEEWYKFVER